MEAVVNRPSVPPEVWCCIFSHLEQPKDLLNALRTCTEWENALKSKKSAIYLSNVFPLLFQYLKASEVFYFRSLCKQIKVTVDKVIGTSYHFTDPDSYDLHRFYSNCLLPYMPEILADRYSFTLPPLPNHPDIATFMNKMRTCRGNPFIGRHVQITFRGPAPSYQPFYEHAKEMLTLFGKGLRELSIKVSPSAVSFDAVSHLHTLLTLVPNIQSLRIEWGGISTVEDNALQNDEPFPHAQEIYEILSSTFSSSPLPPLKKLTSLNFTDAVVVRQFAAPLGFLLVKAYGKQLSTLICQGESYYRGFNSDTLPNLKTLRVVDIDPGALLELSRVGWTPERLQLHGFSDASLTLYTLVEVLNNFATNLVHLEINTQLEFSWTDALQVNPSWNAPVFPKLKFLSTAFGNANSTWFCELIRIKCQNLTVLEFQTHMYIHAGMSFTTDERRWEIVRNHLQVKNWFQILPKLEKMRFWIGEPPFECNVVYRQSIL